MSRYKGEKPVGMEEVPPEARHTLKGLNQWLQNTRYKRGVPEEGLRLPNEVCDESCTLHDHKK